MNQCWFRHSARNLPLKLSIKALSVGVPGLLPAQVPVVHAPEFRTVGLDDQVQSIGVGHLIGLASGLRVGDLDVIQCHDGASSKGLAGTIKNTIILMVLPMDSGG